ncbi:phosphoribosyltransferase [Rhodohalobacter mucosus]|uniref:Phosphoribosyltransferase n=1 Tax=Rhodohalobacter mucosus TaxID=2079485 RepID=A0A316U139_9BACT|nr:phosphoribosyltransferase family protein [Rhodohalobacter mucosus]PWN06546.1 phosphoribosyltransferase [Rhodohalobacter mucosus]
MFLNRMEAGERLAQELLDYRKTNPIVVAIPRGGVETGFRVAEILNCELAIAVSRKLGYLNNPEAAFGAMAEDGSLYMNPRASGRLSKEEIEKVMEKEKKEIHRRIRKYRKNRPFPDLKNRTVIVVDDGIATGSTLMATLEMCKKKEPDTLIVAAPVCGSDMKSTLKKHADDVVILEVPDEYYAVSQVYRDFSPVTDKEVRKWVEEAHGGSIVGESEKQMA